MCYPSTSFWSDATVTVDYAMTTTTGPNSHNTTFPTSTLVPTVSLQHLHRSCSPLRAPVWPSDSFNLHHVTRARYDPAFVCSLQTTWLTNDPAPRHLLHIQRPDHVTWDSTSSVIRFDQLYLPSKVQKIKLRCPKLLTKQNCKQFTATAEVLW